MSKESIHALWEKMSVGSVWEHYKGNEYLILSIGIDADFPDERHKATIHYTLNDSEDKQVWSHTAGHFFAVVDLKVPVQRFTCIRGPLYTKRKTEEKYCMSHHGWILPLPNSTCPQCGSAMLENEDNS